MQPLTLKGTWRFCVVSGDIAKPLLYSLRGLPLYEQIKILQQAGVHVRDAEEYSNTITLVGREAITKSLAGGIASVNEAKITHEELGTGTTAPSENDTGLETPEPTTRQQISSLSYSGKYLYITSFWAAGNATGTWTEYGVFINGSNTSNSGILFSHVGINKTVAATEALTVDGTVEFNI